MVTEVVVYNAVRLRDIKRMIVREEIMTCQYQGYKTEVSRKGGMCMSITMSITFREHFNDTMMKITNPFADE